MDLPCILVPGSPTTHVLSIPTAVARTMNALNQPTEKMHLVTGEGESLGHHQNSGSCMAAPLAAQTVVCGTFMRMYHVAIPEPDTTMSHSMAAGLPSLPLINTVTRVVMTTVKRDAMTTVTRVVMTTASTTGHTVASMTAHMRAGMVTMASTMPTLRLLR